MHPRPRLTSGIDLMDRCSSYLILPSIAFALTVSLCAADIRTHDCKDRQRFAFVAKAIVTSVGIPTEELET